MKYNVDYGNIERILFFRNILECMKSFNSTYDTVNTQIRRLYNIASNNEYEDTNDLTIEDSYIFDDFLDDKVVRREVNVNDLCLYFYASIFNETKIYKEEDMLSDGIKSIYFLLDNIIYPDPYKGRDYENVRYFVEVEYV